MKIVIDIPNDFIEHWNKDRFKDSLRRLNVDAICRGCLSGNYEAEMCEMLISAFAEAQEAQEAPTPFIEKRIDELEGRKNVKYVVTAVLPDSETETMKPRVIGTFDSFVNADIFKRAYEYYYYSIFDTYYDKKKVQIITRKGITP